MTKTDVMPTWAATNSLLLSQSSSRHSQTNSEVIAPLFREPPTDYGTLYTVLMLTQGISNVVVGPERKNNHHLRSGPVQLGPPDSAVSWQ